METFVKVSACALITLVLSLVLAKQQKEISVLLNIAVCSIFTVVSLKLLEPLLDFLLVLEDTTDLDSNLVRILLKSTGIGFMGEIISTICTDAGNAALGKIVQVLSSVLILCLSIPLFETVLNLVQEILLNT